MGPFEVLCSESRLVLGGATRLIVVAELGPGRYAPIALPLLGPYNRAGLIDLPPRLDDNARMIERFLRKLPLDVDARRADLAELLRRLRAPRRLSAPMQLSFEWGTGSGPKASFTLVDDGIYTAVARTVAQGGQANGSGCAEGELERLDLDAAFAAALPLDDASRAIYEPMSAQRREALREQVALLARFRAWGATFMPLDPGEMGRCAGYSEEDHPGAAAEPYVVAARKKYADYPLLLEAVRGNERYWREFDEQDDERGG